MVGGEGLTTQNPALDPFLWSVQQGIQIWLSVRRVQPVGQVCAACGESTRVRAKGGLSAPSAKVAPLKSATSPKVTSQKVVMSSKSTPLNSARLAKDVPENQAQTRKVVLSKKASPLKVAGWKSAVSSNFVP